MRQVRDRTAQYWPEKVDQIGRGVLLDVKLKETGMGMKMLANILIMGFPVGRPIETLAEAFLSATSVGIKGAF